MKQMNVGLRIRLNQAISHHLSAIANGDIKYTMMANGMACVESTDSAHLQEACHFLNEADCIVSSIKFDNETKLFYAHIELVPQNEVAA